MPAIDGAVLLQAGAVTATRSGPEQPFEVVTLPQIEPTPSVMPSETAESPSGLDQFSESRSTTHVPLAAKDFPGSHSTPRDTATLLKSAPTRPRVGDGLHDAGLSGRQEPDCLGHEQRSPAISGSDSHR